MDAATARGEKPGEASVLVINIFKTFLGLFLICTILLERTFCLAATKECIVLPKKIKSYVAMTFCKNVGLVSLCADIYLPREGSDYTCISNYYFIDPVHLIG